MPFTKVGRNEYESPSGRKFTKKQVGLYYAGGGHFPGQSGMKDQFGPSLIRSPTAPGAAARPTLTPSGATNAATSQTPTSILNGGKQTFGPLAYAGNNAEGADLMPGRIADREIRRARKEYNRRK